MKCEVPSEPSTDTENHLSSVYNAMRLIRIFSDEHYEIGLSELSRQLALPKSSVHRLATTLVESNMLNHNEANGKYRLGLLVFELAALMARQRDIGDDSAISENLAEDPAPPRLMPGARGVPGAVRVQNAERLSAA